MLVFLIIWYAYMSCFDWCVHKYIMHNDDVPIKQLVYLRKYHKQHHEESKKYNKKSSSGVFFDNTDIHLIATATFPILYILTMFINIALYLKLLMHFMMVYFFISAHNYCHGSHHKQNVVIEDVPYITVPQYICDIVNNHHAMHHENPKKKFCTIILGFDYIACT